MHQIAYYPSADLTISGFQRRDVLAEEQRWEGHRKRLQTSEVISACSEGNLTWTGTIELHIDKKTQMGRMAPTIWSYLDLRTPATQ